MTPRLTRIIADALREADVDDAMSVARTVLRAMEQDPELLIKWLVRKDALRHIGFVNENKPGRVSPLPLNRNSVDVFTRGLGE